MRALLDVNVWIALFDDAHQFSVRANLFIAMKSVQIATCPLVENGVIRVMSSPHYSRRGLGSRLKRLQAVAVPVSDDDRPMRRARFSRCAWSQAVARRGGPCRGP